MFGKNGGIIWSSPHSSHSARGFNESIGTDGSGWDAGFFGVDAVVHTARATGASIADGHDNRVTTIGELL